MTNTALVISADNGCFNIVKELLAISGIDINLALYYAIKKKHFDIVELLLSKGAVVVNGSKLDIIRYFKLATIVSHPFISSDELLIFLRLLLKYQSIDMNIRDVSHHFIFGPLYNIMILLHRMMDGHL